MRRRVDMLVAVLAATAVPAIGPVAVARAAPSAADGFHVEVVDAGFADFQLTDIAYVDERHVLATGKSGAVRFVPLDDPTASREVGRLDVHADTDLGLVSLALAEDYATSGELYLSSNHLDGVGAYGRLSAWVVDDPMNPTSLTRDRVVLDRIRTDAPIHSVGEIVVLDDGTLYLGVGDGRPNAGGASPETLRTYDLDAPQGKILHVHPDGRGVEDNPWYDEDAPNSWRSRVWAVGLRNPFRFTTLPDDDETLVIGNVGREAHDSLFVGEAGDNFGWPCRQGPEPTVGYADLAECQELEAQEPSPFTPSVWAYDRSLPPTGGVSITGGVFPSSSEYPEGFRDDYLFGDYARQVVWSAELDDDGELERAPEAGPDGTGSGTFASDLGAPVAFALSPSGRTAWADILTGEIVELRWTAGNRPPLARAAARLDDSLTVEFSSEGSHDLDGDALTFAWDFGDGSPTVTGASPTHTYASGEDRTAVLTVDDGAGGTASVDVPVPLGDSAPRLELVVTPGDRRFAVGDPIHLVARARDVEDGDLTDDVEWLARLEHCPPGPTCHLHGGGEGNGGVFTMAFPDHGDDTRVEVRAAVTDSAGRRVEQTYRAEPDLVTLMGASDPAGVDVRVNGLDEARVVVGSSNRADAPAPTGPVRFAGWDDGAGGEDLARDVVAPPEDGVVTARYEAAIDRVAGADRVATAIQVAERRPTPPDVVVLARADHPADALVAAPLAAVEDAPILLTDGATLDGRVAGRLSAWGVDRVVMVGGPAVLSPAVEEAVAGLGVVVDRIAGGDRYGTAAAVAGRLGDRDVLLARGHNHADGRPAWADALAAGPVAAALDRAILLVGPGALPAPVVDALGDVDHATVVGGVEALPAHVDTQVDDLVGTVDRIGGADRYATARLLDAMVAADGPRAVWLATGTNWPDALAAGAATAVSGDRLLLVGGDVAETTGLRFDASLQEVDDVVVAGGTVAVPDTVVAALRSGIRDAVAVLVSR